MISKKTNIDNLSKIRKKFAKKKIGLAHGVFDFFHYGHLLHLKKAKEKCDILIVSITDKKLINKGKGRPFYNNDQRLNIIKSLDFVDYALISYDKSSVNVIKQLKPDIYFKGSDYKDFKKDYSKKILKENKAIKDVSGKIFFTDEKTMSSTNILNNYSDIHDLQTKKFLQKNSKKFTFNDISKNLEKISKLNVLVLGEIIFDEYIFSVPMGKSPKEQLIPVKEVNKEFYGGGSIATANHVSNFVNKCTLVSVFNQKKPEKAYLKKFINNKINLKLFHTEDENIVKKRYIEKSSNLKLFQVTNTDFFKKINSSVNKIIDYLKKNIKNYDLVLIHDFGHEMFKEEIIKFIQKHHHKVCLNVQTNSTNIGYNYITKYSKVNYFSIDEPEARLACQSRLGQINNLYEKLSKKITFKYGAITCGKNGAHIFYNKRKRIYFCPALDKRPVDTLGAGDAFFSISSLFSAVSSEPEIILLTGNIAGSIKIQNLGHRKYITQEEFVNISKSILNF